MTRDLRRWHEDRLGDLKGRRAAFDAHWEELRRWIDTRRGQFAQSERRAEAGLNKDVINTAARRSLRISTSGLHSGMTSPSRPWFKLSSGDDALEDGAARDWLHIVQRRMTEVMQVGNLYQSLPQVYGALLQFGTAGMLVLSDFDDVVRTYVIPVGRFWIAYDRRGRPVAIYRELGMTVQQMVEEFGEDAVSTQVAEAYRRGDLHGMHTVVHGVARRTSRQPGSPLAKDKPWASIWWEEGVAEKGLLRESGFDRTVILGPRWEVFGDEEYGNSPGMDALPDARAIQVKERDLAEARHRLNRPTLRVAGAVRKGARRLNQNPGGAIYQTATDFAKGGAEPVHTVAPGALTELRADIAESEERISEAFYADLFMMFAMLDRRQITAEEIAKRYEEKLLMLGPVIERLHDELLKPLVDIYFDHMVAAELIPPPPDSMQGREIKVEFVSMLAQAQKAVGLVTIERYLAVGGLLAQYGRPEALDKIDADQTMDEAAAILGPPPSIVRSDEDVARIREARAQAEAQAQAIESAQPLAQSAKLISEAVERGGGVPA